MEEKSISHTKVAVVVPVYNAGNKLKSCIRSICVQTLREIVVVLVDDGSLDGSGKVCDEFAKKDKRVVVIHQENRGSVRARYVGVHSKWAQQAEYITLCDADDLLTKDALKRMYDIAKEKNADCVCGRMKKIYKSIQIPTKWTPPCLNITVPKEYDRKDVMDELYSSCFGISNYPVSLWAKIYKTELISEAIEFEPYVKFMGEDLSVTLNVMPRINKLILVPETVYLYRIGGGTSKFMPYMLDDFLALYRKKKDLIEQYTMSNNTQKMIDIELMNVVRSYLNMCKEQGKYDSVLMEKEIQKVGDISEIVLAAENLVSHGSSHAIAKWLANKEYTAIATYIEHDFQNSWKRRLMKKLLKV